MWVGIFIFDVTRKKIQPKKTHQFCGKNSLSASLSLKELGSLANFNALSCCVSMKQVKFSAHDPHNAFGGFFKHRLLNDETKRSIGSRTATT